MVLLSSITVTDCHRHRGAAFGYGFLGGVVGSSIVSIFENLSRSTNKQTPVIIQKEKIIIKEKVPAKRHRRSVPFNTITTTVHNYPVY